MPGKAAKVTERQHEILLTQRNPERHAAQWGVPLAWAFFRDDVAVAMTERG